MSTLLDWMRWTPGDPLPVGPVSDIQTGGAKPQAFATKGITSEQLRAVVEAPGYIGPTSHLINDPFPVSVDLPSLPGDRLQSAAPLGNAATEPAPRPSPPVYAEAFPPMYMAAMEPALQIAPPLMRTAMANGDMINRSLQLQLPTRDQVTGWVQDVGTVVGTVRDILRPGTTVTEASPCASGMRLVGGVCTPSTGGSPGSSGGAGGGSSLPWGPGYNPQLAGGGVPAGQVQTPADVQAVMGRFGVAYTPYQAGVIHGRPILRCLVRGTILGMDNLCYNKRDLRRSERKWKPAARPLLTGGEMNSLRKVDSIRKRLKKAAGVADLSCSKKGCNCRKAPAKGRK